jgi:hypothetical protein
MRSAEYYSNKQLGSIANQSLLQSGLRIDPVETNNALTNGDELGIDFDPDLQVDFYDGADSMELF